MPFMLLKQSVPAFPLEISVFKRILSKEPIEKREASQIL